MDINELIYSFSRDDYQIDNLNSFIKKVSFKYDVPSIHIAGTNGKTVTATYLSNIYRSAGYKTGLFISTPHKDVTEMIKINGENISSKELEKIFEEYHKFFKKYDLSHFEIATIIALTYFQRNNVDIAIIEAGMGGELDATNIFVPVLSVITNVSIEHTDYLGVSLSEIALHKAGIIKNDVPVVIGEIDGDALDVIVDVARRKNSKITRIGKTHNEHLDESGISFDYKTYTGLKINNVSKTNADNACLVIDAIDVLLEQFKVSEEAIKAGLLMDLPVARFEIIKDKALFIIDSAHNPEAIVSLRKDVDRLQLANINVIFGSFNDKNITAMLPEIALLGKLYLTTFDHPRARKEEDYFLYLDEYPFKENYHELIKEIIETQENPVIVITGSTALATQVSEELKSGKLY